MASPEQQLTALEQIAKLETELSLMPLADSLAAIDALEAQFEQDAHSELTPAALTADLVNFKELFAKLRFSYIEQVTKERFLRQITSMYPAYIDPEENAAFEKVVAQEKIYLNERKKEIEKLSDVLGNRGSSLTDRFLQLEAEGKNMEATQAQINDIYASIDTFGDHPLLEVIPEEEEALCHAECLAKLARCKAQIKESIAEITAIRTATNPIDRNLARVQAELNRLGPLKDLAVELAQAADANASAITDIEKKGRYIEAAKNLLLGIMDELSIDHD